MFLMLVISKDRLFLIGSSRKEGRFLGLRRVRISEMESLGFLEGRCVDVYLYIFFRSLRMVTFL